jgi:DNA-directed RNA polymerase subunit L
VTKKKVGPKEEDSDLEDIKEDLFDKEDIDSHYPDVSNDSVKKDEAPSAETIEQTEKVESEEEVEEEEIEQVPELPEYTILKLNIISGPSDNDYTLTLEGQSHGFCNILVKHLLTIEGVEVAAYKITEIAISPPQIFVRLEDGYKLKEIFYKGIDALRNEVAETQKLFKKLM